jgi:hypothetical protein
MDIVLVYNHRMFYMKKAAVIGRFFSLCYLLNQMNDHWYFRGETKRCPGLQTGGGNKK